MFTFAGQQIVLVATIVSEVAAECLYYKSGRDNNKDDNNNKPNKKQGPRLLVPAALVPRTTIGNTTTSTLEYHCDLKFL